MDPISMLLGEVFVSVMAKGTFALVKGAFKEKRRRPSGSQLVQEVARAVRDPRCLMQAVRGGDLELVESLLGLGCVDHINTGHPLRMRGFNGDRLEVVGFTPLMLATMTDNPAMVRLLLHYGANIDDECRDVDGPRRSAVVLGVFYNKLRAVHALLEEGADATSYRTNPHRRTLVEWCARRGNNRMATLLKHYA